MKPTELVLALDQGGHASRALVFDVAGHLISQAAVTVKERRWGERVELDPENLLDSVQTAAEQAVGQLGAQQSQLIGAGLATQRSSLVGWDRPTGIALSPVLSWQDRRAHHLIDQLSPFAAQVHKITGLYLSAHYGASKMRWCLDRLPKVKQALAQGRLCLGPLASFLGARLIESGIPRVDPVSASRTLLWNLYTCTWDPWLLSLFEIPAQVLPECVPSRFEFGSLLVNARQLPLWVMTGDQSATLFALGEPRTDTLYINLGTGAFIQKPLAGPLPQDLAGLLASPVYQQGDHLMVVLEGTVNGAGSALHWAGHKLKLSQLEQRLSGWLEQESNPPLFLNGVSGLGSPFWRPQFPSRFIGEGAAWEKAVAVAESIVFLLQVNIETIQQIAPPCQRIQVSGGLSQLDGLCQRLADLAMVPVYRPAECEATARGLAFLVAGRPPKWPMLAPGSWFYPKENRPLAQRFTRWRSYGVKS